MNRAHARYRRVDAVEAIRLLRETELTGVEIAERLDCNPARLVQICREQTGMSPTQLRRSLGWIGGSGETRARAVPPRVVQLIYALHDIGYSNGEIAAGTGTGASRVAYVLKADGREPNPPRAKLPQREIADRYVAGETTLDLQDAFGVSERTIRRVLDEHGIQRRPRFGRA